jgi:uncharacterized membrane protein
MMKKVVTIFILVMSVIPLIVFAQEKTAEDKVYQSIVTDVVRQVKAPDSGDGLVNIQQELKLRILEGPFKNEIVDYDGVGNVDVVSKNIYKIGDKVLVLASIDDKGAYHYYVTDYVRTSYLLYLFIIFIVILFAVGGWKGFRSILSLGLSFFVIMEYIVRQILDGADPLIVTIIGSFVILLAIIYLTEGFNKEAHVGVVSIFVSLLITVFLSWVFVDLAKLSGMATEETSFLIGIGTKAINFKGLLLAGIIIGALGVLDDIVIAQVATVKELFSIDQTQQRWKVFRKAYSVGISHISSMTNTLFLAYAGASLALLVLFASGQSGFNTWSQAINNEMLATEIVRTLAGSVGLILAVPISTAMATWIYKRG